MKTFESIKETLEARGIKFEVVTFADIAISARTTDTSIDHNYNPEKSIKTLIIGTKNGFVGVIMKGSDRIDQSKLKAIVGKWSVIDGETLQKQLGYIPGTICPLDLDLPILIDESANSLDIWSMGAGANNKGFNVETAIAVSSLKDGKIVSVKQDL